MSINVNGLSASRKTPGVYLAVILGGPGTSAGAAPEKIALLGNKITSALSGASPSFSVAAGTMANATPTPCFSAADAATYAGQGSELHLMAQAVFDQYPDANVTLVGVAESGGNAASLVCTFATTANAAYTIRVRYGAEVWDTAVASGDTATAIAAAVAGTVLDHPDAPFTAQNSSGQLTLTAKCVGPRGNFLVTRFSFVASDGTETQITSSSTTSPGATTGILSGGSAAGSEYLFSGGTTADSVANALAAMEPARYHRIVAAENDATNADLIVTHVNAQAGVTVQKREQAVVASTDTLGNATTLASGRNAARLQCAWHYNSPLPACVVAAQVAAARLIGDAQAGGTLIGESTNPAANLDGVGLVSVPLQFAVADQPTATEIESALNNGVTPLGASGSRPTYTAVVRSITSRSLASGQPNYAVLDTSDVTITDYTADYLQADLATTYAGARLGTASSDGRPPTAQGVVTPGMIRARIAYDLKQLEARGIIRDVDANLPLLVVEADNVTAGRVNAEIPCEPVPGLHILGGNVRQLSAA